ncbi:unnamed protein product, partial [Fusarium fujikuroi]
AEAESSPCDDIQERMKMGLSPNFGCIGETEMSASTVNLETEKPVQSMDSEMTDILDQIEDIEIPDAPQDENIVSSEDGINQFGRGRPPNSSVDQSHLCNSSDAMSCSRKLILYGQGDLTFEVNNRGGNVTQLNITHFCCHDLQELAAFNARRAVPEHQCSPGFDGEDWIMLDDVEYEYDSCKTLKNTCVQLVKTTCIGARCPLEHKCVCAERKTLWDVDTVQFVKLFPTDGSGEVIWPAK